MNSELNVDKIFSENIISIMKARKLDFLILGVLLDLEPSSVSDLLTGKSKWKLKHVYKVARFLKVTTDELIFGDADFIAKDKLRGDVDEKIHIRERLIEDKKYKQLGQLEAIGYFDLLKVAEPKSEYSSKTKLKGVKK